MHNMFGHAFLGSGIDAHNPYIVAIVLLKALVKVGDRLLTLSRGDNGPTLPRIGTEAALIDVFNPHIAALSH